MTDLITTLRQYQSQFSFVVPFDPATDRLFPFDFTGENKELSNKLLNDTVVFSHYVDKKLAAANALYGIGGYAERRTIYSRSNLFDGSSSSEEPRRLHLGTDIWGRAGTAILAPLDGTVHSYAFNNRPGDYGATIILFHELEGSSFYTLYGHLALASITDLEVGDRVGRGKLFAEFGPQAENGQWPPHLHFQVITDIGEYKGDYPGVCRYSEKEHWLNNSPDPDLILGLNKYLMED